MGVVKSALKREKGDCGEFSAKAKRGLEVIAILVQRGALKVHWSKESKLRDMCIVLLNISVVFGVLCLCMVSTSFSLIYV